MRPKWAPGASLKGFADLGRPRRSLEASWGRLGAVLGPLEASWGRLGAVLGCFWDLLSRSWGSCWPPGELFLELFRSLFLNALAKKRKP